MVPLGARMKSQESQTEIFDRPVSVMARATSNTSQGEMCDDTIFRVVAIAELLAEVVLKSEFADLF